MNIRQVDDVYSAGVTAYCRGGVDVALWLSRITLERLVAGDTPERIASTLAELVELAGNHLEHANECDPPWLISATELEIRLHELRASKS